MLLLFGFTLFVNAFLLFLIQPMISRMILPVFGGTPAVWTTCMLFFQAMLLAGYGYSHWMTTRLSVRKQALWHMVVLLTAALVLPITVARSEWLPETLPPVAWLLGSLSFAIALPFFAIAAGAPLLQRWFSWAGHASSKDPYFLYAASNFGNLLALLSYPVFFEPYLRLVSQSLLWTVGYGLLIVLSLACAWQVRKQVDVRVEPRAVQTSLEWKTRGYWTALAFVPSSLMLGLTTYITTDIAAIPLLWIIPLTLYLLTFILAFGNTLGRWKTPLFAVAPVAALVVYVLLEKGSGFPTMAVYLVHLASFFVISLACHGELAAKRPEVDRLTEFYLWISVGGMLGGLFNAVAAPYLFRGILEYPLTCLFACLLLSSAFRHSYVFAFRLFVGTLMLATLFNGQFSAAIHDERSFFGVLRVVKDEDGNFHELHHGTTIHGRQSLDPSKRETPISYYHPESPIGQIMGLVNRRLLKPEIAVLGLGVGTVAALGTPGENITFYEIDPAVEKLARDPALFSYLDDSEKRGVGIKVIIGDGRLKIKEAKDESFGLILADAFSSDSLPMHLISLEALKLYLTKLDKDGVVGFHISNNYLNLLPVVERLAKEAGVLGVHRVQYPEDLVNDVEYLNSEWIALSRSPRILNQLLARGGWDPLGEGSGPVWRDDYANLLGAIQWFGREED